MWNTRPLNALARAEAQFLAANARGSTCFEQPGYRVHIWPSPDPFYRNVAVPVDPLCLEESSIKAMVATFWSARRQPRLELFDERWPGLARTLRARGFRMESNATVMTLNAPPTSRGAAVLLAPEDDIDGYLEAVGAAFDNGSMASKPECDRMRRSLAAGDLMTAIVLEHGSPVAGASLTAAAGTAELIAVWSAPNRRRSGLARAACCTALQSFFEHGGDLVWLSESGVAAKRLYESIGFVACGTQLNLHLPPEQQGPEWS